MTPADPPDSGQSDNSMETSAPRIGIRLGRAEESEIKTVFELAAKYNAPVAVDLLLRILNLLKGCLSSTAHNQSISFVSQKK
ncbi:hypothetical protein, partial [Mesorhizobium sp. M2D.F.Ca.ET.185.01.1.1]|uniref:hypothetical protein n=1 Tax=Mesorhizobium sp. M2D.F.Ca.ET.185.01.1.1 TaxID=2563938 RepID=UPI001AEE8FCF